MSDTAAAPLLTSHKARPSIDETMEAYMGAAGAGQLLKAVLLAFAWALDAQQVFISVFTDAEPPWHCTDADADASAGAICNEAATEAAGPWALPGCIVLVDWWWRSGAHSGGVEGVWCGVKKWNGREGLSN